MIGEKRANFSEDAPSPESSVELQRPTIDPEIERRILRTLDFRVVPILWFLFLASFVDRGNIGNAKIQGMQTELNLQGNMYNVAVFVFTIGYVIGAVPLNIVFRKTGPKALSAMMFCWGLTVLGQGVTKSYAGLVTCRFLEGVCEAAFVPGCAFLIGTYYKKNEFLKRYVVFFTAAITANAINGLFSSLLSKMSGVGGYEGWRWIFIIEALITIVLSFASLFIIVPFPEECTIFTPEEKAVLLARLKEDGDPECDPLTVKRIMLYMMDWKIWLAIVVYVCAEENANSMVNFQPTILNDIGYTANAAQVHTIPVYVVALVFSVSVASISEAFRHRYAFCMLGFVVLVTGLSVILTHPKNGHLHYMGLFFISSGAYLVMPLIVVWISINVGKGYKRAVAMGAVIGIGNCGAFVASNVFIMREAPGFHTGYSTGLAFSCVGLAATTILFLGLVVENRSKRRKSQEGRDVGSLEELGDKHPDYIYQY